MRRLLVLALLLGVLTACSGTDGVGPIDVRPPDVDVDTPALREVKARIGMDDCVPGEGEAVDGGLPDVTLPCLGGGPDVDLASLRGPMVINLWQARCEPCRREMPALEEFHQRHGDRVAVVGIDFNDVQPGAALELAERTGATYPSIADPGGELMAEDVFAVARRGLPAFVFVDADGVVVGQASGGVESAAEVEDLVAEHLGVRL
jgi:thiol-disulfide isomerase/thioredoxin